MSDDAKREWRFYIDDMIEFCEKIMVYTKGMNVTYIGSVYITA
ncbi:MAG: hypothetical protein ABUK01_11015 [Leptospirales bacterium]